MPAILDDPASAVIYRQSGEPPYPSAYAPLPADITPLEVTLRDRTTKASIIPFASPDQIPLSMLSYLCNQINREIEKGDTYPFIDTMPLETFGPYWFANFGAVMLLGNVEGLDQVRQMAEEGCDWDKECLGSFYIKPNYPGRSSHICNGGFLVTDAARNRGVGRLLGESYLRWAPSLGYKYSVFNLVYETNVASCRIWDGLGFKRIGRVPGCGSLKSQPEGHLVDAIIYGRTLELPEEDAAAEERFDKIKYYLKHGTYPTGADRAEKSRLRSAAGHYKLKEGTTAEDDKLLLKGKEVISDPRKQYEIARDTHRRHHGGINKTTASISEKYHWVRIKETVSSILRDCPECKELAAKAPGKGERSKKRVRQRSPLYPYPHQPQLRAIRPPAPSVSLVHQSQQQQPMPLASMVYNENAANATNATNVTNATSANDATDVTDATAANAGHRNNPPVDPQLASLAHQQASRGHVLSASIVPFVREDPQLQSDQMDTSEDDEDDSPSVGSPPPRPDLAMGDHLQQQRIRNSILGPGASSPMHKT